MTTHIIYHDFRNTSNTTPAVLLTAPMLAKGRRLYRTAAKVNTVLNHSCLFLCGACIGVSVLIILLLSLWG